MSLGLKTFLESKMDVFKEFQDAGLVKGSYVEQFDGKDEVTTSGNLATTATPLGGEDDPEDVVERFDSDEDGELSEEACGKIKSAVEALVEVYEMISGKSMGEMFCPNCTKDDMRNAPDSDGNQSDSNDVTNVEKGRYDSEDL